MREILFRGKRTDNGAWIESSNVNEKDGKYFFPQFSTNGAWIKLQGVQVYRDTICAYSGYNDATGRKVFERDIMQHCKNRGWRGVVLWDAKREHFHIAVYLPEGAELPNEFTYIPEEWEVIGNIHDNPELLETA